MSAVISISTGKAYGVSRVCRAWSPSRASVYRDLQPARTEAAPPRRPGPQGPLSDADLVGEIRQVITNSRFHGEGYRKVWARLRYKGIRTSKVRVLRLMRENGLCAKPCQGAAHGPRAHDGTIIPDNIDERPRDVGHRHDRHPPEHRASGRGPCRGRSLIVRRAAWAFMQPSGAHASRRCSRSAGACGTASERAPRTWPLA